MHSSSAPKLSNATFSPVHTSSGVILLTALVGDLFFKKIVVLTAPAQHCLPKPESSSTARSATPFCSGIDSAMSMTPFSDDFLGARVNGMYTSASRRGSVYVNVTLQLEESAETLRPAVRLDIQRHLLGVIHRRNNNIGDSALWVDSPPGSVSHLQGECLLRSLTGSSVGSSGCVVAWRNATLSFCQCDLQWQNISILGGDMP
ncbi:hypothetical protein PR048_007432 [Dryococelus australis]|uniref:Uncharacterized protein n=1 Tax=Dryococelus australis TaxID=614101 RepID=A0ABQ9HVW7_9NEOP|nr:hypothetical protein PR048_007432 [Dryococelus australis]